MEKVYLICVLVALSAAYNAYTFTCVTGPATHDNCTVYGTDSNDAKANAYCHGPDNVVVDNEYTQYGCAKCPTYKNETKRVCSSCPAEKKNNCNVYQVPRVTWTCYHGNETVKCENATVQKACFRSRRDYEGLNATLIDGGCGTCKEHGYPATTCTTCVGDMCNGGRATGVLAPLLLLLAVFVH